MKIKELLEDTQLNELAANDEKGVKDEIRDMRDFGMNPPLWI